MGESEVNARHATHTEFLAFARSLVALETDEGADLNHWTVEERRDFLNWCLENGVLKIEGNMLVPIVPEKASQEV